MIIILNHKSNLKKEEFLTTLQEYETLKTHNHTLILIPSSCYLPYLESKKFLYGSQDVSCKDLGDYTGELSSSMLKSLNIKYVLINHSDRLIKMHETLEISKQKLTKAIKEDIIPIICIGDIPFTSSKEKTLKTLKNELNYLLKDLNISNYYIAYEPISAIGTNTLPSSSFLDFIITNLKKEYNTKVLYGGSVTSKTVPILKNITSLDGFLLGNSSRDITELQKILTDIS